MGVGTTQLVKVGLLRKEARAEAPSLAGGAEVNGDAPLTENGEAQAEAFGEYWAPLLLPKAQQGALHVFCSPMQRNLQTVAPLMRRLHAAGLSDLTAEVRPDNCEVPGCVHAADDETYAEVGRLVADGQEDAAIELMESHGWTPGGLSGTVSQRQFLVAHCFSAVFRGSFLRCPAS